MIPFTYEAHITIDPPKTGLEREELETVLLNIGTGFKLSRLFMAKDTPNTEDAFMTGHEYTYAKMVLNTIDTVRALHNYGVKVRRYKIEGTFIDSKEGHGGFDILGLLLK